MAGEIINSTYLNRIFDKNRHIQKLLNKDSNKKTASEIMNTRMIQSCIHLPKYDQLDISKEMFCFNGGKNIVELS